MKKVLVTGATGFLGSYLLKELLTQPDVEIHALRRETSNMQLVKAIEAQVTWHVSDLLDPDGIFEALEGIDEVYHCAAIISYNPGLQKRMEIVNIKGTGILVDMALAQHVKRLLHVSSIAALGRVPDVTRVDEKAKWTETKFVSHYGRTKQMSELEIWRGVAEGLSANMISPSVIIGPGDWNSGPPRIFTRVHSGQRFYPIGATGFVDVRDVASLAVKLMNSDLENEKVIANGANWAFKRFFGEVAGALGVSPPRTKATPFLAGMAWRVEQLKARLTGGNPLLTRETARAAMSIFQFDNTKSKELFNFNYRNLSETIDWTARAFLKSNA